MSENQDQYTNQQEQTTNQQEQPKQNQTKELNLPAFEIMALDLSNNMNQINSAISTNTALVTGIINNYSKVITIYYNEIIRLRKELELKK